jgi:tRNA 2-thiouridine synthesizing protein E
MVVVDIRGRSIAFNRMGFMADFWSWDEQIAEELAEEDGLTLHEQHWAVIRFLREYYSHTLIPPPPQETLRVLGRQLAHYGTNGVEVLRRLFPKGGCRQACLLAGLPDYYWGSLWRALDAGAGSVFAPLSPSTRRAAHAAP